MVDADAPYSLGRPSTTRKSPPLQSPQRMLSDHRNHTFHLSCQTVEEVLGSHPKKYLDGRNEIMLVFGTTNAGRYAMVVLAEASDGREMVVTARDLNIRERRSFQTT